MSLSFHNQVSWNHSGPDIQLGHRYLVSWHNNGRDAPGIPPFPRKTWIWRGQYHYKFISPHTLTYEILLMTRQASLILWLKEQSGKNKNLNVRLRHSGSVLTFWCLAGTMFTTFTIRACLRSTKSTVQLHQALGFLWCFVVVFCLQLRFMVDLLGDPPRRLLKGGLHTALFYCGDHKYLIFKRWTL